MLVDPAHVELDAGACRLRPTAPADRAGIVAAGQDPDIGGRLPWFPAPFPEHFADGWIARAAAEWEKGRHHVLSILEDGRYCGSVVLSRQADGAVEAAYWVIGVERGRGLASAALRAALAWGETALTPARFVAKARVDNAASHRVLLKNGFVALGEREGQMRFHREAQR